MAKIKREIGSEISYAICTDLKEGKIIRTAYFVGYRHGNFIAVSNNIDLTDIYLISEYSAGRGLKN